MGDSLTAANGALATNVAQAVTEDRSVSWSIGGGGNWKVFLTLPNLIKVFNPNLYGYSSSPTGNSYGFDRNSKFNVAEASTLTKGENFLSKFYHERIHRFFVYDR